MSFITTFSLLRDRTPIKSWVEGVMDMKTLDEARIEIDAIDKNMADLFERVFDSSQLYKQQETA